MSNLEKAAAMYTESWINTLPEEEEFVPSPEYIKWRARLLDKMRNDKYHRLTKRATMVLIAAILTFLLAIGTLAATVGKEFIIRTYYTFANYIVLDSEPKYVKSLELGYIPEGFEKTRESISSNEIRYNFYNKDQFFTVSKAISTAYINFDRSSIFDSKNIDGIEYFYSFDEELKSYSVFWNKNNFIFSLTLNNSDSIDVFEIATNVY